MKPRESDNLAFDKADSEGCSVCRDLLADMARFFDMLETAHRSQQSDWLTVEEISKELKVLKSIVYHLIRKGEIEAINIVDSDSEVPKKGHYRIQRQSLNRYLESKRVRSFSSQFTPYPRSRRLTKVKNYLRP